jgi:hypothetical protein
MIINQKMMNDHFFYHVHNLTLFLSFWMHGVYFLSMLISNHMCPLNTYAHDHNVFLIGGCKNEWTKGLHDITKF